MICWELQYQENVLKDLKLSKIQWLYFMSGCFLVIQLFSHILKQKQLLGRVKIVVNVNTLYVPVMYDLVTHHRFIRAVFMMYFILIHTKFFEFETLGFWNNKKMHKTWSIGATQQTNSSYLPQ